MKNNPYASSSRRRTPWDDQSNPSSLEAFIRDEHHDHFDMHHTATQDHEASLLNSYKVKECRLCQSENIGKKGFSANGIQRYYCSDCKRYFLITTNTIFENYKISNSEWIKYLLNLFGYSSVTLNSKVNKAVGRLSE